MNFTINQTNGIRETVNSEFINKLYNLFITNKGSHTISLSGYLYSPTGYKAQMDALNQQYGPDLVIEVPAAGQYIFIEDPAVLQILLDNNVSSDGIGISVADAADANLTASMFRNNTTITSFNEFPYFTKANTNPPSLLFNGCKNLTQINLSNVIRTAEYEFSSSGIISINAPSLTELGLQSFAYTEIETIEDLGSITTIPDYCFRECKKLVSAVIPTTVTAIGIYAFSAYNGGYTPVFTTITGINNVTNFGNMCFCTQYNLNLDTSNLSPDITVIGNSAFSEVHTSGILHLKKLTSLGNYAFYNSKLTKITCLGKVTKIGDHAFQANESYSLKNSLTEVYLPYECNTLGDGSFWNRTGLTTIKQYTDSVDNWVEGETPTYGNLNRITKFDNNCFSQCSSLALSPLDLINATYIGSSSFENCTSLVGDIVLPNLTFIGNSAFRYCSGITSIDFTGSSLTTIPGRLLHGTSVTSIKIPNTVTVFGEGASVFGDGQSIQELEGLENVIDYVGSERVNIYTAICFKNIEYKSKFLSYMHGMDAGMTIKQLYLPAFKSINSNFNYTYYSSWGVPYDTFFTFTAWEIRTGQVNINVLYFKDLESIASFMFYGCRPKNLIINNITPPTFDTGHNLSKLSGVSVYPDYSTKIFGTIPTNSMIIYVPDSAITTYQADSQYNSYTIRGINEINPSTNQPYLTKYATKALWIEAGKPDDCLITEYM